MTSMSTGYVETGRTRQKQRTRQALVAAARELLSDGVPPTVDAAAARAGISRATAYRYFPTKDELLIAAHPEVTVTSLLPTPAPRRVRQRLETVVSAFVQLIVDTEPQQRAMLRASLDAAHEGLPLRQGRAIGWIAEALEPLEERFGTDAVDLLARAIRSAIGIEALVWLTDIGGLPRGEAAAVMRWSAMSMLDTALRGRTPSAIDA
jgi:AcrR family transcriptional regulator